MQQDEFTLDFQVGTTKKAHKILGQLSGRKDGDEKKKVNNFKAPFKLMGDAYLFALMLGLSTGNKIEVDNRKNYANFNQTVARDVDVYALLKHLGENSDLENQKSAQKAIEEYATWGLMKMDVSKLGDDDYRIGDLLDNLLS
tara:strand:+ start:2785 stop:3210 length:426 start_codon:yes stop_codon:yes gene_type:complete